MEKVATDIYSFRVLRENGFTYVDKTAMLLPLADLSIGKQFFLARPRRFGKSLLVSTLHSLFEGNRELFKGLAIEPKWDWSKTWPVIHLDMGTIETETVAEFRQAILDLLRSEAARLNVRPSEEKLPSSVFRRLIHDVAATSPDGQCVVLIDEYDKPLLRHLSRPDITAFRDELKPFYGVIKYAEEKQRFSFLTGVSKFSKVSIFSDLNNLIDLTMSSGEAALLGYTHEELKRCFPDTLKKIAAANGLTPEEAFEKIIAWYDGYRFEENAEKVINPVSFGMCAKTGKFQNYWSTTAMTTFLTDALKKHPLDFSTIDIDQAALEAYEPDNPRLVTLLYQTGYLTIKDMRDYNGFRVFSLTFPNREVSNSFLTALAPVYAGLDHDAATNYQLSAMRAILADDVQGFVKALKNFFANIPYSLTDRQNEQMWQAIVYVILKSVGFGVNAEVLTNEGRIDMTCETPACIWLVEFKLDRPAEEALAQIDERNYAEKYDFTGKTVRKLGISFSSERRTIVDVKAG